ncbi:RICIN domain-containing protein [Iningainema tapete]|uniref:Ricin B lectin domain-containing protein n=1 Tax=Iningainema tapete BLCC-T55 TaxID=2748662 RepID=A0A8J7BXJ9_9CYAN|nr:hypothetical protein [Iningainema tapete]MBD2773058.1 hypothetical protein [Iningainema tapete BLCC-T55]
MSTQFFLDELDIENLTKIVLRSQQLRTREALCMRIGIDPRRLWFIRDSSDSDFVIQLINHLNEISNRKSLCKLCCDELLPIFRKSETSVAILEEIAVKLNCNQKLSHHPPTNSQTQNLTSTNGSVFNRGISNIIIVTCLIVALGGGLIYYFTSQKQQDLLDRNNTLNKHPQTSGMFIRNLLSGKCIDVAGASGQVNGDQLQLWDCEVSGRNADNGSPTDQKWSLESTI